MFRYKDDLQSYIILRETTVIVQQGGAAHTCVQQWGGGVTSETCSEPYLFAVLMDRSHMFVALERKCRANMDLHVILK